MIHLDLPEHLETDRLVLHRLKYEDAEEIFYTYASKPEVTRYVAWPTHQSIEDTRSFLKYAIGAWNAGTDYTFSIRLKSDNKFIGSFGAVNEDGKIQFGYIFSSTHWNNGYATEVCKRMMTALKNQHNIHRIGTFVDLENVSSVRVLIKAGLKEEARLVKWMRFPNQNMEPKDCAIFVLRD